MEKYTINVYQNDINGSSNKQKLPKSRRDLLEKIYIPLIEEMKKGGICEINLELEIK